MPMAGFEPTTSTWLRAIFAVFDRPYERSALTSLSYIGVEAILIRQISAQESNLADKAIRRLFDSVWRYLYVTNTLEDANKTA